MSEIKTTQTLQDGTRIVEFADGTSLNMGAVTNPNLVYPLNLFSRSESVSPAYVKFNILEIIPDNTGAELVEKTGANFVKGTKDIKDFEFAKFGETISNMAGDFGKAAKSLASARLKTKETGTTVALYMPPAIQINDSMNYDTVDTKGVSEIAAQFANSNNLGDTAEKFITGAGGNLIAQHFMTKYAKSGGLLSGIAANAMIAGGKVANPASKLMFRSPSLRQLQLDFKLTPTSQKEAAEITKIISVFRQAAYPAIDLSSFNALYNVPNLFNIKFAFKNKDGSANPYMIQFKRCYLTQISTTYNGSGIPAFFKDGSPIETNLVLTFQETETNSAVDIHGSGNVAIGAAPADGVGPGKPERAMY